MGKVMFITVGTGRERKDIAQAIVQSIQNQNPDFVVFYCTQKSNDETMPEIYALNNSLQAKSTVEIIRDENDLEQIKKEIGSSMAQYKKRYESTTVDYTSGTKAMSAGIIVSAIENNCDYISYITGTRDNQGRVKTGTEKMNTFRPNQIYATKYIELGKQFFNKYLFQAAIDLFEKAKNMCHDETLHNEVELYISLAQAFNAWDKFDHEQAKNIFTEITRNKQALVLKENKEIKKTIEIIKQHLHTIASNQFSDTLIIDLFKNAQRRYSEGKYDDAIARLYRLLEYIAQVLLDKHNIYQKDAQGKSDTSKLDVEKLPQHLKEKYTPAIGLSKSYELLCDLNDEIGKKIYDVMKKKDVKQILGIRNSSILAHGFVPVHKEITQQCIDVIKEITSIYFSPQQFEKLYHEFEFFPLE